MTGTDTMRSLLRDHLLDTDSQWNLGTFGAIAEFMRDTGERFELAVRQRYCRAGPWRDSMSSPYVGSQSYG